MSATHESAELSLLETLAAAPSETIAEGYVEAAALALYANGALTTRVELDVTLDEDAARCDELVHTLFNAYGRGLVEREGLDWCLGSAGRAALEAAGCEPTVEARTFLAEALDRPAAELLTEVAENLSSRYAMIAAGDEQPVRV